MRGRAAFRRDDHIAIAVLLVDEGRRARLAALAALRRQQKGLRASLPPVADLAAGLPVALHVLFAEQVLSFAHSNAPFSNAAILSRALCAVTRCPYRSAISMVSSSNAFASSP